MQRSREIIVLLYSLPIAPCPTPPNIAEGGGGRDPGIPPHMVEFRWPRAVLWTLIAKMMLLRRCIPNLENDFDADR